MTATKRKDTVPVMVGGVQIGGGAPVVVQSMTDTDTTNIDATVRQVCELARAGSELVRFTVNTPEAAEAVPEIHRRVRDAGCQAALVGDFHYNGHILLAEFPECARALDKYRINPGNVGRGKRRDERFTTICRIAVEYDKPVRIGVNVGSLDEDLVADQMRENADEDLGKSAAQVLNECIVLSAVRSTERALEAGLKESQIVISCKSSTPTELVDVNRELSRRTRQPIHLGLTEAGMGAKGLIWSTAGMSVLLAEGIGDTIRVSLTPRPGSDRREEVHAAREMLQALGLRKFAPTITSCPGCGRTSSTLFQELAQEIERYVRERAAEWGRTHEHVEDIKIAVMGCIVNGPGESKAANIGISLPGRGETPQCPVYLDGQKHSILSGSPDQLAREFEAIIEDYVASHCPPR